MPKTLLLADDSVTIQKVVGISFANEDVVLLTVDNGDDAVARAREARPDLVLADVMMPGKDGYEVCEAIKSDPELRHVPVLLLSGTFEPFDEERARRVGADGHITKPFEAQALVDQVNALLARASAPPPAPAEPPATPAGDATIAVGGNAADAFDFFDEELAQTAPSPSVSAATGLDDEAEPLELETAVEDDLPLPAASLSGDALASPGDSQTTVLFEDEPSPAQGAAAPSPFGGGLAPEPLASPPPAAGSGPASPMAPEGYEESFDFGFEDGDVASGTPLEAPAPAPSPVHEAVTQLFEFDAADDQPVLASPPPIAPLPEPAVASPTPPPMAPISEPAVSPTSLPPFGMTSEPAALPASPPSFAATAEPAASPPPPLSMATTAEPAASPTPPPSMTTTAEPAVTPPAPPPMATSSEPAIAAPPPMATTFEPAFAPPPPPVPGPVAAPPPVPTPPPPVPQAEPAPAAGAPEPPLAAAAVALSEPIQRQLQETLEKIVWEAFGDLSERIVRDVIERVESVAWEVIPQMAETLIREEIRRLKGEDA